MQQIFQRETLLGDQVQKWWLDDYTEIWWRQIYYKVTLLAQRKCVIFQKEIETSVVDVGNSLIP